MIRRAIVWLFEPFCPRKKETPVPQNIAFRVNSSRAALVLIHGLTGNARDTWSRFSELLLKESSLATWDVHSVGFPSSMRVDVPNVWDADPELALVARQLITTLSVEPFRTYEVIAFAAHSMGGLVVQRALLDDPALAAKTSHVFLFGTPSLGLPKSRLVKKLKRQFRDMSPSSDFIRSLRRQWNKKFSQPQFALRVIGGERDEFVPSSSSLKPFPSEVHAVIPGNHIEIVRPVTAQDQGFRIVLEALAGKNRPLPPIDGARLAVELGKFKEAVAVLLPQVSNLDDNAAISLGLALESIGRGAEALEILVARYEGRKSSTDVMGTLAGRLKRRWLASGNAVDYERALALYAAGLREAENADDHDQAFYHAINISFLKLIHLRVSGAITEDIEEMARKALDHCDHCKESQWRIATEGEALLILGKLSDGIARYRQAICMSGSQREIDSMYAQALRVAERMYGEEGLAQIEITFGLRAQDEKAL